MDKDELKSHITKMIDICDQSNNKKNIIKCFDDELKHILPNVLSPKDLSKLKFRCIPRGYFNFFYDIYCRTKDERKFFIAWVEDLKARGHKVNFRSHGVDNNGLPVLANDSGIAKADFKVIIDGKKLFVDVKVSPNLKYFTFKLSAIKRYIESGANILLIMRHDHTGEPRYWQVLGHESMEKLLKEEIGKHGFHFNKKNKTVRVTQKEYLELIYSEKFSLFEFGDNKKKFHEPL